MSDKSMHLYHEIKSNLMRYTANLAKKWKDKQDIIEIEKCDTLEFLDNINQKKLAELQAIYTSQEKKQNNEHNRPPKQEVYFFIRDLLHSKDTDPSLRADIKALRKDNAYIESLEEECSNKNHIQNFDWIENIKYYMYIAQAVKEIERFHDDGLTSGNYQGKKREFEYKYNNKFINQRADAYHELEENLNSLGIDKIRIAQTYDFIKFNYDYELINKEKIKFKEKGNDNYTKLPHHKLWDDIL